METVNIKLLHGTVQTLSSISEENWHIESTFLDVIDENPHYRTLSDLLKNLAPEVRAELVALMLIGRGDIEPSEFGNLKLEISSGYLRDDYMWMAGKPIHQYLQVGLKKMKKKE